MDTSQLAPKYPMCARYVGTFLSSRSSFSVSSPKVYTAFIEICSRQFNSDERQRANDRIDEVFSSTQLPTIIPNAGLAANEGGTFKPIPSPYVWKYINISTKVLDMYENPSSEGAGWMAMEGTILHECVHWVRYHAGNGDEPGGDWNRETYEHFINKDEYNVPYDGQEVGQAFEILAYGGRVTQVRNKPNTKIPDWDHLLLMGPPGHQPENEDNSPVPSWARGWWAVYTGSYYYYYFYSNGSVVYVETRPNPMWVPPTVTNRGQVTMTKIGLSILWNSTGTKEDFVRLNWTSETEMNGTSQYGNLYAKKM